VQQILRLGLSRDAFVNAGGQDWHGSNQERLNSQLQRLTVIAHLLLGVI
jgi:hypothetical protein